jgi:hypothetical protein
MSEFWYRVNVFVAQYTAPEPPPPADAPVTFWYRINSVSAVVAGLFRRNLVPGPGATAMTDPDYFRTPRPWWDQRGIPNATEPEQPEHLDLTDLDLLHRREW